jgi:hypothetical protein
MQQVMQGLQPAFYIAAAMSLVAAVTSLFRGRQIYAASAQRQLRAHSRSRVTTPHRQIAEPAEHERRGNRRASHS